MATEWPYRCISTRLSVPPVSIRKKPLLPPNSRLAKGTPEREVSIASGMPPQIVVSAPDASVAMVAEASSKNRTRNDRASTAARLIRKRLSGAGSGPMLICSLTPIGNSTRPKCPARSMDRQSGSARNAEALPLTWLMQAKAQRFCNVDLPLEAPHTNESPPLSVSVSGKRNFCGPETVASKRPVTFNRSSVETKPRKKTHQFGATCTTPGNLCLYWTAWWGWEDSNFDPSGYFSGCRVVDGIKEHCSSWQRATAEHLLTNRTFLASRLVVLI